MHHEDLQAITWETDFGDCIFKENKVEAQIPEDHDVIIAESPLPEDAKPTRVFHGRIPYNILDHKTRAEP